MGKNDILLLIFILFPILLSIFTVFFGKKGFLPVRIFSIILLWAFFLSYGEDYKRLVSTSLDKNAKRSVYVCKVAEKRFTDVSCYGKEKFKIAPYLSFDIKEGETYTFVMPQDSNFVIEIQPLF